MEPAIENIFLSRRVTILRVVSRYLTPRKATVRKPIILKQSWLHISSLQGEAANPGATIVRRLKA